tara:strand:+ start:138 stop:257 length:120 start_codon:yes stop_codon:yes gene_type:complete
MAAPPKKVSGIKYIADDATALAEFRRVETLWLVHLSSTG